VTRKLGRALALALLVVCQPGYASSADAQRVPIFPRHGRPFRPVLGNWEGAASLGEGASFELAYAPRYAVFGSAYSYRDLVAFSPSFEASPSGCPVAADSTGYAVFGENGMYPLNRVAGFGLSRYLLSGGVVSARRAVLVQREAWPPGLEYAHCPSTLTWTFHPEARRPVKDGEWTIDVQGTAPQRTNVLAGGRIVKSVELPNVGECNAAAGGVSLLIAGNGEAQFAEPGNPTSIRLAFTSPTQASGSVSIPTQSCGLRTFALTASLTKAGP